jgi:xylan 1,4-beta-xylosidase
VDDTYLPAFESCVRRGRASGIMCSYNAVNGVPSCADKMLLEKTARQKWGFEGYITSDCGAVSCVQNTHHYTNTTSGTCKAVLDAGMDIDCGSYLPKNLPAAISSGTVTEPDLDRALANLFKVQMRIGWFDPISQNPWRTIPPTDVNSPKHQALALDAARQGIVLLHNPKGVLPLSSSTIKKVALVGKCPPPSLFSLSTRVAQRLKSSHVFPPGPNADATTVMQGNYFGTPPYLISPKMGFEGILGKDNVAYAPGCAIKSSSTSGFAAACTAAKSADAVVVVIGLNQSIEREGHDRDFISLPGVQDKFVSSITACVPNKPVIVMVMSGGPVDLTHVKADPGVAGIFYVGYPGQSGGQAMAEAAFGRFNPSGRLSSTVYHANYINQVSMEYMGMRPNSTNGSPGRSYRFFTGEAVYPFGHGLSYTTFAYRWHSQPDAHSVDVEVENTGRIAGADAVLAFHSGPNAGKNGNAIKSLVGFEKVRLAPGEKVHLSFEFPDDLMREPGSHKIRIGPYDELVGTVLV